MIVPRYWAEARVQQRRKDRQVTVRRFGWSQTSMAEAEAAARARAEEALRRVLSGETLRRREPKVPYNGAEGVPIREEIVAEHGETVITRNSYGALCLNTPNVVFADVDFVAPGTLKAGCGVTLLLLLGVAWMAWSDGSVRLFIGLGLVSVFVGQALAAAGQRIWLLARGGVKRVAERRVRNFARTHPHWRLRVYRTPAGLRVAVAHRTFAPEAPEVAELFRALGTDPIYVSMCRRQHCFRARLSPKPWRMKIESHLKPRPGVWPVRPERQGERQAWLASYDAQARSFAACHFDSELGRGEWDPVARAVLSLHDEWSRAETNLALA